MEPQEDLRLAAGLLLKNNLRSSLLAPSSPSPSPLRSSPGQSQEGSSSGGNAYVRAALLELLFPTNAPQPPFAAAPLPAPPLPRATAERSIRAGSSLRIVPFAVAVVINVPVEGLDRVIVKPLSSSNVVSPATLTVMILLVWPLEKLTVPEGSAAPMKSAASAGFVPLPVTRQLAVLAWVV